MNVYATVILWTTYLVSLYFAIFFLLILFDKNFFTSPKRVRLQKIPFISIIIPAYNEEETILGTLTSVLQLDYPKDKLEVIVVDDGSTDRTKEKVEQHITTLSNCSYVNLISHENIGKAASLNHALQLARGDFFACLDADSFVEPDTLQSMLAFYYEENDSNLKIVTPVLKVKTPRTLLQKVQWLEYLVMAFISRLASHIDSLYVAPGPFSLYHTATIKELGGFDERNITEDQEIAYRVQASHYRIKQCPTAFVHTIAPATLRAFSRQRRRWYKGSISCLHKYRGLILNKRYGDFGIIQLLKNLLGFFIALSGISFAVYLIFLPSLEKIHNLYLISFDVFPYIENASLDFPLIGLNIQRTFIMLVLFAITILFFTFAHRYTKEKVNKFGLIPLVPYFLFYYLVKGSILIFSLVEYAVGRKQRW